MSIQALREQLSHENRAAKAILAEKGSIPWTAEDQAKFDAHMVTAERLQSQIEAHQRTLDDDAERNFNDADKFRRTAVDKAKMTDGQKALDLFMRKSDRQLTAEEALLIRNTMSTTTGGEGGFTVRPEVAQQVIEALKSYGSMRRVAGNITTSMGNDLSYPTTDGTSEVGEIVAQNAAAAAADVTFGTRALNVFKFSSKVVAVPIELLQDSLVDIQALVQARLRTRIGRIQNQMFSTGTGTGQPTGLAVAASVGKTGATGQTTSIIYDDLVDMIDSLDIAYTDEASTPPAWMTSQTLRKTLRKLKDTAGRPLWMPSYDAGITRERADQLMGFDVVMNNDMPTPAANAKSLAFGQLGSYMTRDTMQVTLFRFDDSAYIKLGQIGFLAWARAGGNLLDLSGVKVYQHSTT
jgi:HK97 family phage major capsid protein